MKSDKVRDEIAKIIRLEFKDYVSKNVNFELPLQRAVAYILNLFPPTLSVEEKDNFIVKDVFPRELEKELYAFVEQGFKIEKLFDYLDQNSCPRIIIVAQALSTYAKPEGLGEENKRLKVQIESLNHLIKNASEMLLDITKPNEQFHINSHIVDHALIVHCEFKKLEKQLALATKLKGEDFKPVIEKGKETVRNIYPQPSAEEKECKCPRPKEVVYGGWHFSNDNKIICNVCGKEICKPLPAQKEIGELDARFHTKNNSVEILKIKDKINELVRAINAKS